jgi:hypothetical protein
VIATLDTGGGRRIKKISLTVGILLVGVLHISCGSEGDENPAAPGSQEAERIIAATSSGIFRSSDQGVSWSASGALPRQEIYSLIANERGDVLAGADDEGAWRLATATTAGCESTRDCRHPTATCGACCR